MQKTSEILDFNFSYSTLQQAAEGCITPNMKHQYALCLKQLDATFIKMGEGEFKFDNSVLNNSVFEKFKTISGHNSALSLSRVFNKRELKCLAYLLNYSPSAAEKPIFISVQKLELAIHLLNNNWKDYFLFGLIRTYLENWQSAHVASFDKLKEFILSKLQSYKGDRLVLKSFKNNLRFFNNKNGPTVLGAELAIALQTINDATNYISIPKSWFGYIYFSDAIVSYFEKNREHITVIYEDLAKALVEHGQPTTSKRLISKLIILANAHEALQDKVKSIAFKLVGDPGNAANWTTIENSSEKDNQDLKLARRYLNEWITRQFINVFFEKCINDIRRKRFWLQYANHISQFRVVGSNQIKQLLLMDNRINEYVGSRFSRTTSSNGGNAALMFVIKDHLFIEFSDNGAFYVYKPDNPNVQLIENLSFYSISDLKITSMPMLAYRTDVYINSTNDEGKLGHNDGNLRWEQVAEYWINEKIGIDV